MQKRLYFVQKKHYMNMKKICQERIDDQARVKSRENSPLPVRPD